MSSGYALNYKGETKMKKIKLLSMVLILALCLPLLFSCGVVFNADAEKNDVAPGGTRDDVGESVGPTSPDYDGYYGEEPDSDSSYDGGADYGEAEGGESTDAIKPEGSEETTGEGDDSVKEQPVINLRPAGLMTASAWDDNTYYDYWSANFAAASDNGGANGKFAGFSWGFNTLSRVTVTVTANGAAVAGATVVTDDFAAKTNAAGVAYLFTSKTEGSVTVTSLDYSATASFTAEERELSVTLEGAAEKRNVIELMFVVDVTGSMGDELGYLKNELADVVERVSAQNQGAIINLALLFYRDYVDAEVFRYYDFTNVTDAAGLAAQQAAIDAQHASGGGDTPEAVDEVLELAVGKQWSADATTKLIFLVLDAPPHSDAAGRERYCSAVSSAAEKGIRICPVICSGANTLTEYLAREAALSTGGTFVYVTDDSGIGGSHHDPELPNTVVEALNSLMVRLINGYHTGEFADPVPWKNDGSLLE